MRQPSRRNGASSAAGCSGPETIELIRLVLWHSAIKEFVTNSSI